MFLNGHLPKNKKLQWLFV